MLRDSTVYEPIFKRGRAESVDTIRAMAAVCRQCADPACVGGCPAGVHIRDFVGHIAAGRMREAYMVLRERNVLATICGYVCPSEELCQSRCHNQHYSFSVPIRHLQRWVGKKALREGWSKEKRAVIATGQKVAIIGAGPAGLAAASILAGAGHQVTIFDHARGAGGVAAATIPAWRLPEDVLRGEINDLLLAHGELVRWHPGELGRDITVEDLVARGYAAICLAFGLSRSVQLPSKSRPRKGVIGALEFLADAKKGKRCEGRVLVLGGGNTAIDAALSAKASGAKDVIIVYRRSFAEMPALPGEKEQALEAGIEIFTRTAPVDYDQDAEGNFTGLKVVRTCPGAKDKNGRCQPVPVKGSEHTLAADLVIEALGQQSADVQHSLSGITFSDGGLVIVDPKTNETARKGVFAAGDLVSGAGTVVGAVASGVQAGEQMNKYLETLREI